MNRIAWVIAVLSLLLFGFGWVGAEERITIEERLLIMEKQIGILEERNMYLE